MGKPSFDQFADMLDQAVDRIPSRFLRDLTGGCFIMFYYGSFVELLEDESEECWEAEIVDTVLHEMQHHLESLAGCDDLARKEMEELAKALQDRSL